MDDCFDFFIFSDPTPLFFFIEIFIHKLLISQTLSGNTESLNEIPPKVMLII